MLACRTWFNRDENVLPFLTKHETLVVLSIRHSTYNNIPNRVHKSSRFCWENWFLLFPFVRRRTRVQETFKKPYF